MVGNELVFRDDNHFTVEYARTLARALAALADPALLRPVTPRPGALLRRRVGAGGRDG
jgi:hypothetical protein